MALDNGPDKNKPTEVKKVGADDVESALLNAGGNANDEVVEQAPKDDDSDHVQYEHKPDVSYRKD